MKISDFIKTLEGYKQRLGDVQVLSKEYGFGGYAMCGPPGLDHDELHIDDCEDASITTLDEIFLTEDDKSNGIKCIVISTGETLFST